MKIIIDDDHGVISCKVKTPEVRFRNLYNVPANTQQQVLQLLWDTIGKIKIRKDV